MQRIKVGDNLLMDYAAIGAAPQPIFGHDPAAQWVANDSGQMSVLIQNRSGADIEVSTDPAAVAGILIADGDGITIDIDESWNGTIWGVVGAITVAFAVLRAGGGE